LVGAAVGLLTNGLFALRFRFRIDAAAISALHGGLGAVLYAVMSTATQCPPRGGEGSEDIARFFRKLGRVTDEQESRRKSEDPRGPGAIP